MKSNFFVADLSGEKSDRFSDCLRDSARGNALKFHAQTFCADWWANNQQNHQIFRRWGSSGKNMSQLKVCWRSATSRMSRHHQTKIWSCLLILLRTHNLPVLLRILGPIKYQYYMCTSRLHVCAQSEKCACAQILCGLLAGLLPQLPEVITSLFTTVNQPTNIAFFLVGKIVQNENGPFWKLNCKDLRIHHHPMPYLFACDAYILSSYWGTAHEHASAIRASENRNQYNTDRCYWWR